MTKLPKTVKKNVKPVPNGKLKIIRNKEGQILLTDTLFEDRHIYLHSTVGAEICDSLMAELKVLDSINQKPIYLHVNSPGGYVSWGFALIDTLQNLRSKVITIGTG